MASLHRLPSAAGIRRLCAALPQKITSLRLVVDETFSSRRSRAIALEGSEGHSPRSAIHAANAAIPIPKHLFTLKNIITEEVGDIRNQFDYNRNRKLYPRKEALQLDNLVSHLEQQMRIISECIRDRVKTPRLDPVDPESRAANMQRSYRLLAAHRGDSDDQPPLPEGSPRRGVNGDVSNDVGIAPNHLPELDSCSSPEGATPRAAPSVVSVTSSKARLPDVPPTVLPHALPYRPLGHVSMYSSHPYPSPVANIRDKPDDSPTPRLSEVAVQEVSPEPTPPPKPEMTSRQQTRLTLRRERTRVGAAGFERNPWQGWRSSHVSYPRGTCFPTLPPLHHRAYGRLGPGAGEQGVGSCPKVGVTKTVRGPGAEEWHHGGGAGTGSGVVPRTSFKYVLPKPAQRQRTWLC